MEGNPAGWYDDPDEPESKRYWDGSGWTEDRAPAWNAVATEPAVPFDLTGEDSGDSELPLFPDSSTARATPRSRLVWVAVASVGVFAVIGIVAVLALALGGDDTDLTRSIEHNVPIALQQNYAEQGLVVTVSGASCDKVTTGNGPFATTCTVGFSGTDRTLTASVVGTIDGNSASIDDAASETTVLDETLAIAPAQALVDQRVSGLTVTGCSLPQTPLVTQDGDEFTCTLNNGQVVSLAVDGTSVRLTGVS